MELGRKNSQLLMKLNVSKANLYHFLDKCKIYQEESNILIEEDHTKESVIMKEAGK